MKKNLKVITLLLVCLTVGRPLFAQKNNNFIWPQGKKMAISLTFDDARQSQPTAGTALLNEYGIKGTFYLVPSAARKELEGWKKAVADGHEIGNHSINHPCSGNFVWSRETALENYTLEKMHAELLETNKQIKEMLGVTPEVYAYPCGAKFVGRGVNTQSYVPVISELFLSGRGWVDEAPVDPTYCDMAQLTGMPMDAKDFEEILPIIEAAKASGQWLVLAGHEMADSGGQTTRLDMLRKLCAYAKDPANGIWIAPIGEIGKYVKTARDTINIPETVTEKQGQLLLTANAGKGTGPKIQYMPEWKAFGWFTAEDKVEWDMNISKSGQYEVHLTWSVSDEDAGKPFVLETSKQSIKGTVGKTGSWETFLTKNTGKITLAAGKQKIVFRPGSKFEKGALMDLKEIKLVRIN